MVMMVGALITVTPLWVALRKRPTVPIASPAVKLISLALGSSTVPINLVCIQEYVMPEGQVPVHVTIASKDTVAPSGTVAEVGEIDTEDRAGPVTVMIAASLCTVVPLNVALTKTPTCPSIEAAVKETDSPIVVFSAPIAVLVVDHEYAMPAGQAAAQVGVAVKVCFPPVSTDAV
jgi:hypothetical protein